ncbi:hypothetical protein [Haloquadratum walsbyi]|jgi:hypothetical protein|uniref:Uncharacterized protein n=1 Tax=Haloquadratum walsbyi (strain DSM 16790 / HBSQ001) TaxID=362976 RepID=Q18IJ0_HALWD|nr:hypothetical protein [Haloquadratum walsbyi]CAJ52182.1 uncharacterized protein HQ_2055A [Haloquadratum walsbyi DSM 16790]
MVHDPLSPSEALRTKPGIILGGISLFIFVYSLIITAQLLLGGLLMLMLTLGVYGFYRIFTVLDAVADAQQRIATVREQESNHNHDDQYTDAETNHDSASLTQDQTQTQTEKSSENVDDNE